VIVDGIRLALALVGVLIVGGMLLYSVRLLIVTRGGILSRGWKYIALGTISLSIGIAISAVNSAITVSTVTIYASIGFMNIGGVLFVVGLRSELGAWSLRRLKDQPNPILAGSSQIERERKA